MRQFYLEYKDNEKLAPLVQEISWTKNVIIMISRQLPEEMKKYLLSPEEIEKRLSVLVEPNSLSA